MIPAGVRQMDQQDHFDDAEDRSGTTRASPTCLRVGTVLATVNRDRGASHDAAPPTPPGIRVRTMAVRRIKRPSAFP